jgi:hypothetical protein
MASDPTTISEGNIISVYGHTALPTHYQSEVRRGPREFLRYEYPIHNEPSIADTDTTDLQPRECTVQALSLDRLNTIYSAGSAEPVATVQILYF